MNSPRHHEMDKLQAIDQQRAAIAQRLDERLPRQYTQLLALVATTKWRLTTLHQKRASVYTQDLVETTVKKLRMEVGAFEYAAKEQSELLTRALFQLDDILSHGDATIKDTRKALVLSIQQLLERADAMKVKATSLKEFTDRTIDRLPVVADEPMEEPADANEAAVEVEAETESASMEQEDDDWEQVHADDMRPLFASEDEEDAVTQEEEPTPMDDAVMVQPEATENETPQDVDDQEEDDAEEEEEEATATDEVEEESNDSLPLWRPYYQIQKRPDGVYIVANLRGVDPRAIQVHAMPQQGVVRIAGFKYPTQKDLLLSRLSGAPTFGRFEIVERFPAHMLNLENASQQLSQDGTLQVRLPYYFVEHPRVMRRISPFQPHGLMVW